MKETILIEYVRIKRGPNKGQPRGIVIATGAGKVGWSFTNTKSGDRFDKEMGIKIAMGRCGLQYNRPLNDGSVDRKTPQAVTPVYNKMVERSQKYFKDDSYRSDVVKLLVEKATKE